MQKEGSSLVWEASLHRVAILEYKSLVALDFQYPALFFWEPQNQCGCFHCHLGASYSFTATWLFDSDHFQFAHHSKCARMMELEPIVTVFVGSWHRTWQSEGFPRGSCRLQDRHLEWTHGSVRIREVRQGNFWSGRYPSRSASPKTRHLYSL